MRILFFTTLIFIFFQVHSIAQEGIAPNDFSQILNTSDNVLLLDVQIPEKYKKHRIPGHIYAGEKSVLMEKIKDVGKNTKILIYCTKGKRSAKALKLLKEEGFSNVYHLQGGINEWKNKGFPVDTSEIEMP